MNGLKDQFLLEPGVTFLNHGSFGATPRKVFDSYQDWQRKLEAQPVRFLQRQVWDHLREAQTVLGEYVGTSPENLVFVPNATFGVNAVAQSLQFQPGDEILTSNHEYGACSYTWEHICRRTGAVMVEQEVPLPVLSSEAMLEALWEGVTDKTRLIFISHISSPTALTFPVESLCRQAREAGILTCIDGAHAPGQVSLDLDTLGADFYTGNCHKWLMAPKGAAFLYVSPECQGMVAPLVVSWGWEEQWEFSTGSRFQDLYTWLGTRDPAAYLSVPAAVQFQREHGWDDVRRQCSSLVEKFLGELQGWTGMPPLAISGRGFYHQMASAYVPGVGNPRTLKARLYDEYRIEVPILEWNQKTLIRLSVQGYNNPEDLDLLLRALQELL